MKIRTLSETQLRQSWWRLLELLKRGYEFRIKRRGKVVARMVPSRPTMFSRVSKTEH